jgi:hypothetical protein
MGAIANTHTHLKAKMVVPNAFPVVESSASLRGPQFQANRKSWDPLIDRFQKMCKAAMAEGEERHTHRHQDRGQLLGKKHCNGCMRVGFWEGRLC